MTFREASLETSAAPDRVWRVWSDVNSWPEWNPGMKESRLDGAAAGRHSRNNQYQVGGKHEVIVSHLEHGMSFELESTALPLTRMAIRATLTPAGGGTRLTQAFEPRGLLAPIVGP
jgi:hypothetical protein